MSRWNIVQMRSNWRGPLKIYRYGGICTDLNIIWRALIFTVYCIGSLKRDSVETRPSRVPSPWIPKLFVSFFCKADGSPRQYSSAPSEFQLGFNSSIILWIFSQLDL